MQDAPPNTKKDVTTFNAGSGQPRQIPVSTQAQPQVFTPPKPQNDAPPRSQRRHVSQIPGGRLAMFPAKGYKRNPLLRLPRNEPCPCRSGKKYKACCLPTQAMYIPAAMADQFEAAMKRPDLVFMTEANQAEIEAELAARRVKCEHDWETIVTKGINGVPDESCTICKTCLIDKTVWNAAMASVPLKGD